MMKRLALLMVLVLGLAAASAARSQQPSGEPTPKSKAQPRDTVDFKPSPELQKALEDLAAAVQSLALRIASDPQIKAAAMNVASGAVTTAQQVVSEQSVHIQEALKTASERISSAQSSHQKPKKP
jgi:ABC-type glycerol-3-phosphate transport system substrate-binding protein